MDPIFGIVAITSAVPIAIHVLHFTAQKGRNLKFFFCTCKCIVLHEVLYGVRTYVVTTEICY